MTFNPTLVKSSVTLNSTELFFNDAPISMNNNKVIAPSNESYYSTDYGKTFNLSSNIGIGSSFWSIIQGNNAIRFQFSYRFCNN